MTEQEELVRIVSIIVGVAANSRRAEGKEVGR
jgi:hypothetical protein